MTENVPKLVRDPFISVRNMEIIGISHVTGIDYRMGLI